jgi:hypothetical protein
LGISSHDFDPQGPLELKRVEEKFVRTAAVMELVINGQTIKTTAEHPFYVPAQERFVPAGELQVGDLLVSSQGTLIPIESISQLDEITTVYNLRVADHHTYFVGGALWGWDVWVHNAYKVPKSTDDLIADNIESTAMLRKLHPGDPDVLDNALVKGKPSGSYINQHASGTPYIGKGPPKRAAQSANDVAKRTGDPHVSTQWESAIDEVQALIDEARKIRQHGGIENLHNRINSPGEKL